MKRFTGLMAAMAVGCAAAQAQQHAADDAVLTCRATHAISCRGTTCESEAGDSFHVTVDIDTRSGAGNLCTFTYCRDFRLTPEPGETMRSAMERLTGFTLSESSGSTEEFIGRPAIDYQLSIAEGRSAFMLFGAGDAGIGGWSGACERKAR